MSRALENLNNLHFNGLLLNKAYNVWANKSTEELCLMALNADAKFEGKLTWAFKNDVWNLANFQQCTFERLKIGTLMGSFYPKEKMYELKFYRGIMRHDNEEQWKICREIDLSVQNWHEEFAKLWPEHLKFSKNCTLMGCFWPKYMFELKKVQRSYVWWHWILMQNVKEKWLVLSKRRIWQILAHHRLKNSYFK